MSRQAYSQNDLADEGGAIAPFEDAGAEHQNPADIKARPIPRISIQAFCEDNRVAEAIQLAAEDRRLSKTHVSVHMGGIAAALQHYQDSPTPNLIVLDTTLPRNDILGELDQLAQFCDGGTKVVVIGRANDVILYRELLKRGVSEYLVAPTTPLALMESISNLYNNPDSDPVGSVISFIGAKGGVGSSTVCHNVAWTLSEIIKTSVVIADLDLAFGTSGLDFNHDPVQGIADALATPERLDEVLLDRLLTKCSEHLSLFAPPVMLDRDYDLSADSCDMVIDVVRQNVPQVLVDLPHAWTSWTKKILLQSDEIVITAQPDLANLRNAKNMIDVLRQARTNDAAPKLVLNMTNVPKRPEISAKEFCQNLDLKPAAVIEYDCETFGQAANNGQMIEEVSKKAKAAQHFRDLANLLTNRKEVRVETKKPTATSAFGPLLEKFKLKR
jgi:pilus assembly protein CpaE